MIVKLCLVETDCKSKLDQQYKYKLKYEKFFVYFAPNKKYV